MAYDTPRDGGRYRRNNKTEAENMKKLLAAAALAALVFPVATPAQASIIERACLGSDRPQATRSLCRCIQHAADRTLTTSEQRQAARFFRDPDRAQQVRMSRDSRDSAFWERYRNFSATAEAMCQ